MAHGEALMKAPALPGKPFLAAIVAIGLVVPAVVAVTAFAPQYRESGLTRLRGDFSASRLAALWDEAAQAVSDSFSTDADLPEPSRLSRLGLAVRLIRDGRDRGCFALWTGVGDLPRAARAAALAALRDPRYAAVARDEIPELTLELSVFGGFEAASGPFDFVPGEETLMVLSSGDLTLIQAGVMVDHGISKLRYVESICVKAGLSRDAWKGEDLAWYRAPTVRIVRPLTATRAAGSGP